MKTTISILIGLYLFLLLSCEKVQTNDLNENCELKETVTVPEGFELKYITKISEDVQFKELQFVNDEIGYVLAESDLHGYTELFKTDNQGSSWKDLDLNFWKNPINMFFMNKDTGFISYYGSNGNLFKTIDGGNNWTDKIYHNLSGNLYHIQKDKDNNLYAIMSEAENNTALVRSTDNAESWQIINDSKELHVELITFSFKLFEEKIYISGKNKNIIITDLNGNKIEEINTGQSYIWSFEILNYNEFVVVGSEGSFSSSNGGLSWNSIYDGRIKIIDLENFETGLFIYSKSHCPVDYIFSNDVITYTTDGGINWKESQETTNIKHDFVDKHKRADGNILILLVNEFYKIEKM